MARTSGGGGGANNMHPLSWGQGGHKRKRSGHKIWPLMADIGNTANIFPARCGCRL